MCAFMFYLDSQNKWFLPDDIIDGCRKANTTQTCRLPLSSIQGNRLSANGLCISSLLPNECVLEMPHL